MELYAIYSKSNNSVTDRFRGKEEDIATWRDLEKFGYVLISDEEFSGDPREYVVDNGKIVRRNITEIIAEIEEKNPMLIKTMELKQENSLLYLALAEMSILSAQQEQQNIETQNAIAELSLIVAKRGV